MTNLKSAVEPRVLYIDPEDDLPALLDRVEDAGTPAIVVLPEGARAIRGMVAARLLKRRADTAGIRLVVVTTDRTTIAQLTGAGIPSAPMVGEARHRVPTGGSMPQNYDPLDAIAWNEDTLLGDQPVPTMTNPTGAVQSPAMDPTLRNAVVQALDEDETDDVTLDEEAPRTGPPPRLITVKPSTGRARRWLLLSGIGLFLVLAAIGIWGFFFPLATITITYAVGSFDRSYQSPLGTGGIPIYTTHVTQSASQIATATGSTLLPGAHATGTITFANTLSGSVYVPAGVIVDTTDGSGGIQFVTLTDVRVAGAVHTFTGTTNGEVTVQVQAVLGGTSSNLPAESIHGIEGRLRGVLLVTNMAPITGGTMRAVYALTQDDVGTVVRALHNSLVTREAAILNERYAKSPTRFDMSVSASQPTIQQYTVAGKLYAHITLSVRTDLSYVHQADVDRFSSEKTNNDLEALNQRLLPGTRNVRITVIGSQRHRVMIAQVKGRTAPNIDLENLKGLLTGRSVAEANALLSGSAHFSNVHYHIQTSPEWAHRLPQATQLIQITLRSSY